MKSIFTRALDYLTGNTELKEKLNKVEQKLEELTSDRKEDVITVEPVCKNRIIYNAATKFVTVVDCNNDTFSGEVEKDVVELLKTADTREIIRLLTPEKVENKGSDFDVEKEESEIVKPFLGIFEGVDDFEVVGDKLFFKNIRSVEIPPLIVARFVEILQKRKEYEEEGYTALIELQELNENFESLKAFTLKLLLNPLKESRDHALEFVRNFDIKITNTGNMIMYRRIVATGSKNKALVEFVSKQYLKVKSWKKSPSKFKVITLPNSNIFELKPFEFNVEDTDYVCLGDLNFLYSNLSELKENRYTDDYTKTYDIRIGATYKIREEDIDLNKNGSCGGALHVADGKVFNYNSFGNTPVCCIVSPQHIYKMDSGCSGKIGVRQMFIAAVTTQDDNGNYEDIDSQDLVNFDELYHNESLEQLQQALRTKSLESTSVSTAISDVSLKDVEVISNLLKSRIVTI